MKWLAGFTPKLWLAVCGALIAALPLSYCKGRADGRELQAAKQAQIVAAAVAEAIEAERAAQRTYETERPAREAEIDELRRAADAAPDGGEAGPKTRAVLEGLRPTTPNPRR